MARDPVSLPDRPSAHVPTPLPLRPQTAAVIDRARQSPLSSLIGRDAEVAAVAALLRDGHARLLTVTGPGGVGKTRLARAVAEAMAVADDFADGAVFVPLAAIRDPDLVLPTISRAVGLREDDSGPLPDRLVRLLGDRRVLLVLDNFEQVAAAAAAVAALLEACPGVSALVTSRRRLGIDGERRFPLAPLALPDPAARATAPADIAEAAAVRLLVARAQAVEPRFRLTTDNAAAVAAICRRLDGLPLAIELAAVRLRALSPSELLARLDPMLPWLADGPVDAPERLRTMDRAIAWSHDLLGPVERRVFRRLAVFVGGFSVEAAEAVVGDAAVGDGGGPAATLDALAALLDASLLERRDDGGRARFAMLEPIREFAGERLRASGERAEVVGRHAAWHADLAEDMRREGGLSRRAGLERLETEHPNIRAALAWLLARGDAAAALRLAGSVAEFWLRHGHLNEGSSWLERALAADDGPPTAARANALVGLSMLQWGRFEPCGGAAADGAASNGAVGDQAGQSDGFARAARLAEEAEAVARAAADPGALAYARLHQSYIALHRGQLDLAEARGAEALSTWPAIPQRYSFHGVLWVLATVALHRGADALAEERFRRLLAAGRDADDVISIANALVGLAELAGRRGAAGEALRGFAEAAEAAYHGSGDRLHAGLCLERAAVVLSRNGRAEPAVRLFAAAAALHLAATGETFDRRRQPFISPDDAAVAAAGAALPPDRFAALWAAGAMLSVVEAIAEIRSNADAGTIGGRPGRAGASRLSARERELVPLLIEGRTDKEIAAALGIARRTASNHVASILAKLGVPSRTAIAALAIRDELA